MRQLLLLAALTGCAAADAKPFFESAAVMERMTDPEAAEIAKLRAEGPAALTKLLATYDAMKAGTERDTLGDKIDRVAAQRYATSSRMFWYTNLDTAKAEAKKQKKPILSLRMLGRLDEDMSCANSRYFRIALYANTELSKFLRDNFILHWSSEREVPRITVDFGDGRKLERTITGNSIHYVLDAEGRPIDALPGLYAAAVFKTELADSLKLMTELKEKPDGERTYWLSELHRQRLVVRNDQWKKIAKVTVPLGEGFRREAYAQMATVTKSGYEMPTYRVVDLGVKVGKLPDDAQVWAQLGVRLMPPAPRETGEPVAVSAIRFSQGGRVRMRGVGGTQSAEVEADPPVRVGEVLDASSKALLKRLAPVVWSENPMVANDAQFAMLVNRFERDILADTGVNEFDIRLQVRGMFINYAHQPWDQLNALIYSQVFRTPKEDAWLGLAPAGITALPGDGLVRSRR